MLNEGMIEAAGPQALTGCENSELKRKMTKGLITKFTTDCADFASILLSNLPAILSILSLMAAVHMAEAMLRDWTLPQIGSSSVAGSAFALSMPRISWNSWSGSP